MSFFQFQFQTIFYLIQAKTPSIQIWESEARTESSKRRRYNNRRIHETHETAGTSPQLLHELKDQANKLYLLVFNTTSTTKVSM